jgi:hypothetical protein
MTTLTHASSEATAPAVAHEPQSITIYSHSPILYWWPVWLVGFVLALVTYLDGGHLVYAPPGTQVEGNTVVTPADRPLPQPQERLSGNPYLGCWLFVTLLVVFVSSSVQLRGLWEWIAILTLAVIVLAVLEFGLWGPLLSWLQVLHIRINLAGYVFLSAWLFAVWVVCVFVFDRRTYLIFSAGQVRVRDHIGQAEKVYDVTNMTLQVQPNIFLRHRVLGLYGAGDLVLRPGGSHGEILEWPNVLFARSRLKRIECLLKERAVVS